MPACIFSSLKTRTNSQGVSKLPTSHGARGRTQTRLPAPTYALCLWTQAFPPLPTSGLFLCFNPSLLWVTLHQAVPCRLLENVPATQWRDTETPQTVLSTSPRFHLTLTTTLTDTRNGVTPSPSVPSTDLRYTVGA